MINEDELKISLEEATYDYICSYEEYERYHKFYKNDCEVYHTILGTYFPKADITIAGTILTLTIPSEEVQRLENMEGGFVEFEDTLARLSDDVSVVKCVNDSLFVLVKLAVD